MIFLSGDAVSSNEFVRCCGVEDPPMTPPTKTLKILDWFYDAYDLLLYTVLENIFLVATLSGFFVPIIANRAVARTLIGGGGCLFIYSCSARLVSFQIDKFEFDFKRN